MIRNIKQNLLTPEVYSIYSLCMYAPTYERFAKKVRAYLEDEDTAVYGFYEDRSLFGIIVLRSMDQDTAEIIGIAVDQAHQHQHIGKILIEYAATIGPYWKLHAETDDDAVLFYKRCGFQIEPFYMVYNEKQCKRYRCIYHPPQSPA